MIDQANTAAFGTATATLSAPELVPSPYLHVGPEAIHDPMTDRTLTPADAEYLPLRRLIASEVGLDGVAEPIRNRLETAGWLVAPAQVDDLARGYHLKFVSLEAHTVCNQACYFCPVSISPREAHFMSMEEYRRILGELVPYRSTLEAVFMISYNEPTADKRFIEQVRAIKEAGLPPATLTNGSGLTPQRTDDLVEMGGLRYLSINLSTLDRQRYAADRGNDQLELVLRNLDYARDRPVGEQMEIVVLGQGDEVHQRDFEEIQARFADSRFVTKHYVVNDRTGLMQTGLKVIGSKKRLRGCDLMGSRPIQHLHINPHGQCILCCQDYHEVHVVGDLTEQTVEEVLTGPEMQRMRRMIYGLDEAPRDFICRHCPFALT